MEAIKYYLSNNLNDGIMTLLKDNSTITITNSLGRIEYANDNFSKIMESDTSRLIGETLDLMKSPLHTGELYKNLWQTIKMGHKWSGILSDTSPSGIQFWLETTIIPIIDNIENTTKYLAIYTDITKIQRQNNQLLESNFNQENFLKSLPQHVFSITKHGKILNANKSYYNHKVSELIGTYIYDYVNPRSFNVFKRNIEAVFTDRVAIQFEGFDFDSSGEKYYFTSVAAPVFNELGGIVSATITIHKTIKVNQESDPLDEQEANYRSIFKSINVGIIVVADDKGNITEWNKGAELAFGYTKLEMHGRPLTVLMSKKLRNGNLNELLKEINKIKNNQNTDIIEMCCLHKNGKEFPVEFALSSWNINDSDYYCAMMLDITKRKALENKLKQKTKDLELFLYRSAHDLKAPFSSAEGLLNLLREEKANQKIMSLIKMLDTTIKSGKVLADNLTQASIISTKNHQSKKINFKKVIGNVLSVLSGSKNFELCKFNIDINNSHTFNSNPELINSIFQNLIQNAIKYSKKPTKKYKPLIDISVKSLQNYAVITVCDNGQGITENCIKKIFDLYYRANIQDIPGNGLGLYIVKNIVDDLKGEITVISDLDKGSCFEIILPNS